MWFIRLEPKGARRIKVDSQIFGFGNWRNWMVVSIIRRQSTGVKND